MLDGARILAVHHDPGRNGGSLLFQTVLEGLVHDHGAAVSAVFPREGPLVARARALGPVRVLNPPPSRRDRLTRLARRGSHDSWQPSPEDFDVVFANSSASLATVERLLNDDDIPLVVYVHESSYLLQHVVDFDAATRMLRRASAIFAVSDGVRATLERLVQPAAEIVVIPGFAPIHSTEQTAAAPLPALEQHLSSGRPIVAAIGTLSWYKGTDLFIVVAQRVRELLPDDDIRFLWVGEEWRTEIRDQVEHDVRLAGLEDAVVFPGTVADPSPLLQSASLFLLPSREDSWPLVMLEAAAEGVPMVCFAGSGGAEEFIATGGGTAVPYLDVEAMAQTVVAYLTDPGRRA